MGHIGKPPGYPLQVLAVAVGFTLLSLMRQEVSVAYSFLPFSPLSASPFAYEVLSRPGSLFSSAKV